VIVNNLSGAVSRIPKSWRNNWSRLRERRSRDPKFVHSPELVAFTCLDRENLGEDNYKQTLRWTSSWTRGIQRARKKREQKDLKLRMIRYILGALLM